jgi:hypothetical protein
MFSYMDEEEQLPYPLVRNSQRKACEEYLIPDADKKAVLKRMYPFEDIPELDSELFDLHEESIFVVKDFKGR